MICGSPLKVQQSQMLTSKIDSGRKTKSPKNEVADETIFTGLNAPFIFIYFFLLYCEKGLASQVGVLATRAESRPVRHCGVVARGDHREHDPNPAARGRGTGSGTWRAMERTRRAERVEGATKRGRAGLSEWGPSEPGPSARGDGGRSILSIKNKQLQSNAGTRSGRFPGNL